MKGAGWLASSLLYISDDNSSKGDREREEFMGNRDSNEFIIKNDLHFEFVLKHKEK